MENPRDLLPPNPFAPAGPDRLAVQWAALREAASVIASLAGPDTSASAAEHLAFPGALRTAPERRRPLIEQTIGDLIAIMEPGLRALLTVHEQGGNPGPAAQALWQEFVAARGGLLALAVSE